MSTPEVDREAARASEYADLVLFIYRVLGAMDDLEYEQQYIAQKLGRSESFVSELLRDQQRITVTTAMAISRILTTDPSNLMGDPREPPEHALYAQALAAYREFRRKHAEGHPPVREVIRTHQQGLRRGR